MLNTTSISARLVRIRFMLTAISAITGAAAAGSAWRQHDAPLAQPLAARGAHEVLLQRRGQLRRAHARAGGGERRADDQARQPDVVHEAQQVLGRGAVAGDRRQERDLGDRAGAGREQQQHHQPDEVHRRGERERGEHRHGARPRASAGGVACSRAGEQPGDDREADRARQQVAVDEEAVAHHLERRARADERVAAEVLARRGRPAGTRRRGSCRARRARPAARSGRPG